MDTPAATDFFGCLSVMISVGNIPDLLSFALASLGLSASMIPLVILPAPSRPLYSYTATYFPSSLGNDVLLSHPEHFFKGGYPLEDLLRPVLSEG